MSRRGAAALRPITTPQGNRRREPHGDRTPVARKVASLHVFVSNLLAQSRGPAADGLRYTRIVDAYAYLEDSTGAEGPERPIVRLYPIGCACTLAALA